MDEYRQHESDFNRTMAVQLFGAWEHIFTCRQQLGTV
jgi:hypothetical protein